MNSRIIYTVQSMMIVFFGLSLLMPSRGIQAAFHETYELAPNPMTPEQEAQSRMRHIFIAGGLLTVGAAIGATTAILSHQCHNGSSGSRGIPGVAGNNGLNGLNGPDGAAGATGATGISGVSMQGPTGTTGATGVTGPFFASDNNQLIFDFTAANVNFVGPGDLAITPYVVAPDGTLYSGTTVTTPFTFGPVTVGPPTSFGVYHCGLFLEVATGFTSANNGTTLTYGVLVGDTDMLSITDLGQRTFTLDTLPAVPTATINAEANTLDFTYEPTNTPPIP